MPVSLTKQSRNAEIDFYRLVMTLIVIFHHSRYLTDPAWLEAPFPGGYLPVEFFFILTGYFAVRKVMDSPDATYEEIPRWMWKKFVPILKFDFAIGVVHRLIYSMMIKMPLVITIKELIKSVYDLFFLRMAGFVSEQAIQYNQSNWYLSAIFLVLPFFFAALLMNKKLMFGLIAPLSPILIYGYQVSNGISLATGSLIRAWGGVCLGAVAYALTEKLKKTEFTKSGRGGRCCL